MGWYCYAIGALPALWLWLFIGGSVVALAELLWDGSVDEPDDNDFEEVANRFTASLAWPLIIACGIVVGLFLLVRTAPSLTSRLVTSEKETALPRAKVVK